MERHKVRSVALVFLIKDGQICLGKRKNTGTMDGYWATPAGHVEEGESARMGMIREAKEETGIDINPQDLELAIVSYRKTPAYVGEAVDFFFTCTKWQGDIINAEPDKCEGWDFYDINALPSPMVPSQVAAIKAWQLGEKYMEFGF